MLGEWGSRQGNWLRSGPLLLLFSGLFMLGVFGLYRPALHLELMGDDYQWLQHTHHAVHSPALLFADLDTFYRPATTWTLALDRYLWGTNAAGYHLTNLVLHVCAALLLVRLAGRMGISKTGSWAIGAMWATSPYTFEPAASVAIRFENLLFLSWLGLILVWPRSDQSWSAGRLVGVGILTSAALFSKETWVVTAGLVLALEWGFRRSSLRRALIVSVPFFALAVAYSIIYFLAFPGDKHYFQWSLQPLAKIPHQLAAFFYLEELRPAAFPFTLLGVMATGIILALFIYGIRIRFPGLLLGAALFWLPMLPTVLVPYLPSRYTTIPYAGFLLVLAATLRALSNKLPPTPRRLARAALGVLVLLVICAGGMTVRADLRDFTRMSLAHTRLLKEARLIGKELPLGRPIAVVRMGDGDPLHELIDRVEGQQKVIFVRGADPYGLVDSAALFEWISHDEELLVRRYDERLDGPILSGGLLAHRAGGFAWLARNAPDAGRQIAEFQRGGHPVSVIECERFAGRRR